MIPVNTYNIFGNFGFLISLPRFKKFSNYYKILRFDNE